MASVKRRVADVLQQVTGSVIMAPNEVHLVPERQHLRRLFEHFQVDCVFDIGANAGQYASMLREHTGYRGPIVSFEPIPELVDTLRQKSAADADWHIEQIALDREEGRATFHVMRRSAFSSLHRPSKDQPGYFAGMNEVMREIEIERSTVAAQLDRWRERLNFRRPFLKIDTQGNDLAVVEGAGDRIGEFVGLQSELAIQKLYEGGVDFTLAIEAYRQKGFEVSALVPNNDGHFPFLVEIDCIMVHRNAAGGELQAAAAGSHCQRSGQYGGVEAPLLANAAELDDAGHRAALDGAFVDGSALAAGAFRMRPLPGLPPIAPVDGT